MIPRSSDMDYRDALYGLPEEEIQRRQEEEARAERWAAFVSSVRHKFTLEMFCDAVSAVAVCMAASADGSKPFDPFDVEIEQFAETEGWDGVLNAIARAMREEETYRRELVDRR